MNKYDAFRTGQFEKLELSDLVSHGIRSHTAWRFGWITYRPEPWMQPVTEDIVIPADKILTPTGDDHVYKR